MVLVDVAGKLDLPASIRSALPVRILVDVAGKLDLPASIRSALPVRIRDLPVRKVLASENEVLASERAL